MIKLYVALLLSASSALAAQQASDFTVSLDRTARSFVKITALPPAGHHINIEAPMDLLFTKQGTHLKPVKFKKTQVVFSAPDVGANDCVLSLYLCDEHNTYCEKHQVTVKWETRDGAPGPSSPGRPMTTHPRDGAAKPLGTESQSLKHLPALTMLRGFILNNPTTALEKARKERRPLLIDFFGIWCPPCNMLDETVFSSPEFRKATAGFIKLKLDADSDVSWELKSRYRVSGYPTVVLTSSDGDEISRIVGFRPLPLFVKEVRSAWDSRNEPYAKLKQKADAGDSGAAAKVGMIHLERHEFAEAARYLARSPEKKEALFDARIGVLAEKSEEGDSVSKEKLVQTLEEAVDAYPDSFDTLERRQKLADAYDAIKQPDKQAKQLKALILSSEKFATDPAKLAGHDASPGDLWENIADAQEKLGAMEEARKAWKTGFEEYGKELKTASKGSSADTERGYNIERAFCLWKSGDAPGAEKLYSALEKRFPEEFTFYFGHARMNFELKNYEAARVLVLKSYQYSYGDNKLRAAQLIGKIYDAQNKPKEGLELVREALTTAKLPDDKSIRTHRYYRQLQDLEQKLAQRL